jgi:hypothetical protein
MDPARSAMVSIPTGADVTIELTIVVPAFNEADRLVEGFRRFEDAASAGAVDVGTTEVLLVDDGSSDNTADMAGKVLAPLPHGRVIRLPANRGKGAAVRAGVAQARGRFVAFMDADMAIDPRSIADLLELLPSHEVVIGSRALPDSMVETTYALRALMGRLFNQLVTSGTGLGLHDTQCGFKGFQTPTARLLFQLVTIDRFAFDVDILLWARRFGLGIAEVPVQWKHVPGSTVHPWHDSLTMLADVYRSRLGLLKAAPMTAARITAGNPFRPGSLSEAVRDAVAEVLPDRPVPIVVDPDGVTVLWALVEPAEARWLNSELADRLAPCPLRTISLTGSDLRRGGPLRGRIGTPRVAES